MITVALGISMPTSDQRGRNQNLRFVVGESPHRIIFFSSGFMRPCIKPSFSFGKTSFCKPGVFFDRCLGFDLVGLFHERADDKDLLSFSI